MIISLMQVAKNKPIKKNRLHHLRELQGEEPPSAPPRQTALRFTAATEEQYQTEPPHFSLPDVYFSTFNSLASPSYSIEDFMTGLQQYHLSTPHPSHPQEHYNYYEPEQQPEKRAPPRRTIAEVNSSYRESMALGAVPEDPLARQVVFSDQVEVKYYKKGEAPSDVGSRENFLSPLQSEAARGLWPF